MTEILIKILFRKLGYNFKDNKKEYRHNNYWIQKCIQQGIATKIGGDGSFGLFISQWVIGSC